MLLDAVKSLSLPKILEMKNSSGRAGKSFGKRNGEDNGKKSFGKPKSFSSGSKSRKPFDKNEKSSDDRKSDAKGDGKPGKRVFRSEDFGGKPKKDFNEKSGKEYKERRSYSDKDKGFRGKEKSSDWNKDDKKSFGEKRGSGFSKDFSKKKREDYSEERPRKEYGDKKSFGKKRDYNDDHTSKSFEGKEKREYKDSSERKGSSDKKSFGKKREYNDDFSAGKFERKEKRESKDFSDRKGDGDRKSFGKKREYNDDFSSGKFERKDKRSSKDFSDKKYSGEKKSFGKKREFKEEYTDGAKEKRPRIVKNSFQKRNPENDGLIRLNKYISNSGVCSRREADKLIESGAVTVNGKIVAELGFKVSPDDVITYGGQAIKRERKVYVLLNKPKDYITTLDDPEGRKTVMELVKNAGKERIYPVGRLDRNTTGLLMLTNDGEMAMKLTHPKHNIQKMYAVEIDRGLKPEHLKALHEGIELEDGFIKADKIEFVGEGSNRKEIGIEIHSGRNRIVRRMFEHFDYNVVKLDRVMFAGLTKKDLPRGKWRFLSEKEISFLKMLK